MQPFHELAAAVEAGDRNAAKRLTQDLLDAGADPEELVERGLVLGMHAIGERFKRNEAFVPEMLVAARAMKEAMAIIEPRLVSAGVRPKYTAVIGTVQGDLHDIGKNLVATMWRGANFDVVDLGTNVAADRFAQAVATHRPQVVGLSALLTTTMAAMRDAVRAIRGAGDGGAKILIGGAPVTEDFAAQIGADGFASDAASAVDVALRMVAAPPGAAAPRA